MATSIASSQVLTTYYLLLTTHYLLLITDYLLLTTYYLLPTTYYLLLVHRVQLMVSVVTPYPVRAIATTVYTAASATTTAAYGVQ